VEVNCATLRGDAAMAALFGHTRGAFTGAANAREGLLRAADGGVLFLDEIGELGADEQAMLLHALETGRFLTMGADKERASSFQLIAGTNTDLETATHAGTYMYHSGTNPGLQVEMGLTGAIIVRPPNYLTGAPPDFLAYGHADTAYGHEQLFFLTEMDPRIHTEVEFNGPDTALLQEYLDNYFSNYWFINGRTAPDGSITSLLKKNQ